MVTNSTPLPFTFEESSTGIKVHIRGKDNWPLFLIWVVPLFLITTLGILFAIFLVTYSFYGLGLFIFQGRTDLETAKILLTTPLALIIMAAVGFGLYLRWYQALAFLPGHEVLEFDDHNLTITRSHLIRHKLHIPASRIRGISHSGLSLLGLIGGSSTLPVSKTLTGVFKNGLWVMRTGALKLIPTVICLALDYTDANALLARIHDRYPQYR